MDFKSTTKLDTNLKKSRFHIIDRTLHTTYDLAYNKIINLESEDMFKEKDLIINSLNKTINNLNQTIVDLVSSKKR